MLKNQTVNHVSEHLSAICPVYTLLEEGLSLDRTGVTAMYSN